MKFWLDGQEWDTDKPVYILGYRIIKTWFPMNPEKELMMGKEYGCVLRKEYISNIIISHEGNRSWVSNFYLTSKNSYNYLDYSHHIVAMSVKKAKEQFEKMFQEMYGG